MHYYKPANLLGSVVYNPLLVSGGDVSISKGRIFFGGLPDGIKLSDIKSYTRTVYAAGTQEVRTLDLTGIAVANSTQYRIIIQRLDTGERKTYLIFTEPSGNTASTIAEQIRLAINNDPSRIATATGATDVVILTEINTDTKGFIFTEIPIGATDVDTTPHVEPSGTYPEAFAYDPINSVPAGQYTKYTIVYKKDVNNAGNSGGGYAWVVAVIFADEGDANYGDFDDALTAIVTASGVTDAVAEPYVQIA